MKRFTRIVCFTLLLLLLIVAVPVSAALTISPHVGYTGKTVTVTITGTNFTAAGNLTGTGDVKLTMSDEDDISASTISSWTDTTIVCNIKISSTKKTGDWNIVVVKTDDSEVMKGSGFTILNPMVLTSISPTVARVDTESVDFTLGGTGLSDVSDVFLYNADYDNITADNVDVVSSTKVNGTFDLTNKDEDTYDVCVEDSYGTTKCDLSFKIVTNAVGSIYFETNPDGATVYLNTTEVGTSTFTYDNATPGTYKVVIKKDGYKDYGGYVTVNTDKRTVFYAKLVPLGEGTTATTTAATATPVRTATTIKKSTMKVPTTWPSDTPTEASPVDPAMIIGAVGIGAGLVAFRRQ